jgi:preprotein translocase subunit SecA
MDDLKQSVQNATYEQKDPLLIYKFESFNLFKVMISKVNKQIIFTLAKGHIPMSEPQPIREGFERRGLDLSKLSTSKQEVPGSSISSNRPEGPSEPKHVQPVRVEKRVGRNDPCPCGSGKKFKACHGKDMAD